MENGWRRSIRGVLIAVILFVGEAYSDTVEFLTYSPPRGWTRQAAPDGTVYRRPSGIGLIYVYASYAASGSAQDEFASLWRARVEPTVPGPAPIPQLQRDGDYALAVGAKQVDAQGTITMVSLVAIVGRGRAIGVLTMAAGDDSVHEAMGFLDGLKVKPDAPVTSAGSTGVLEVDFDVPPGYVAQREGGMIVLTPTTVDENTPCAYGVSPARPSTGVLETDARAALLEPLPGWQTKGGTYYAMRGTSGDGWPYYWVRMDVQRLVGASYEYAAAMTMAFPSGPGRVNIVWGAGNLAHCTLDDVAFARLFHSLRPRGWSSDGGKALARDLQGTWRNSQRVGIAQYRFMANGRYEYGVGIVTTTGLFEKTSASASDGRYELRGAELKISPDRRERGVSTYRVRIYEKVSLGQWQREMSLLDENARPPLDVQYLRIDDSH